MHDPKRMEQNELLSERFIKLTTTHSYKCDLNNHVNYFPTQNNKQNIDCFRNFLSRKYIFVLY